MSCREFSADEVESKYVRVVVASLKGLAAIAELRGRADVEIPESGKYWKLAQHSDTHVS